MKRFILFSLYIMAIPGYSQQILSIELFPESPTAVDSVEVVVTISMAMTGCNGVSSHTLDGNVINASTLHCVPGAYSVFCQQVIPFELGLLPEGVYQFHYLSYFAWEEYPCEVETPNVESYFTFSVGSATDVLERSMPELNLFPNPAVDFCTISSNENWASGSTLVVTDLRGSMVMSKTNLTGNEFNLDVSALSPGMYLVQLHASGERKSEPLKLLKIHK